MQESTSLLILWLLSSLKQERSTLCLIQMLECPAAQAEIALHRVTADGLAEQRDETWNLTQAGADHLREALPALLFRDTGSPLEELISACESQMPETACEICTKRMRVLRRRADTAGSAGYLELLLNQLAQWQNRRLTAPEARSFVHYAFAAHDASLYYMKNAARSSAFMKKAAEYAASAGDKRTLVLIRFAQASATFFTGTIHFERAHETFHSAMELLKTLDLGLEDRLTARVGLLSGGQRQALTLLMATMNKPKLLLLDEHTAALDPKTALKVLTLSAKIVEENHLTTMMITHNMKDAIKYGNRLIMMYEGHIIYDVSGEEKKNLHVSDLLAKFQIASGGEFANDRMILSN